MSNTPRRPIELEIPMELLKVFPSKAQVRDSLAGYTDGGVRYIIIENEGEYLAIIINGGCYTPGLARSGYMVLGV